MTARWHALAAIGVAAVVAGCGTGVVQCGACPPAAYVNVTSGDSTPATALTGTSLLICVPGLPCEIRPFDGGTVALTTPVGMDLSTLDGRAVTVTASRTADSGTLQATGRLVYRHEDGPCGCSGVRAQVTLR